MGLLSLLLFSTFSQDPHALCIFSSHTHTQTSKHPPRVLNSQRSICCLLQTPGPFRSPPFSDLHLFLPRAWLPRLTPLSHFPFTSTPPSKNSLPRRTHGPPQTASSLRSTSLPCICLPCSASLTGQCPLSGVPHLDCLPCQASLTWTASSLRPTPLTWTALAVKLLSLT